MAAPGTRVFEYSIRDAQGKLQQARIEAPNEAAVAARLRSMGLAPVSIQPVVEGALSREIKIPGLSDRIKLKDVSIMSRQLATMIQSGLSLIRALNILSDQTESKPLSRKIQEVRADVEQGNSLSNALGRHPETFPPLMVNMVKAGEVGGFLDTVLVSIASNFEATLKLRNKVKSAMTYPTVVFIFAIIAVIGMLLFIVPVFEDLFGSLGGKLPPLTAGMVWVSKTMKITIVPTIAIIVGFVIWWGKNKRKREFRERVEPLYLKMPVFGNLMRKIAIARFCRNFGAMIHAGVPILQALDIVGESSGNIVIEKAANDVRESIRTGNSLSGPLASHKVFPPMVVQMIAVGEDTGALDQMLAKIADFYDQEVESTTDALTSLIEPLMIVVLGSIIGVMVVGLYQPIFGIFALIE